MRKSQLAAKICVVVTAILFGFMICGTNIADKNSAAISNFFGSKTYKIVETEDASEQDTEYFASRYNSLADLIADGKEVAEEIESEGVVLLKNDNNALPLDVSGGEKNISLVGISSIDPAYGGKGSAQTTSPQAPVTPQKGFENAGFSVNSELIKFYTDRLSAYKRGTNKINDAPWADIAGSIGTSSITSYGDAAIVILSRVGGEGSDLQRTGTDGTDGDYLKLSANEISVLKGLKALKDSGGVKKIIVLFNTANQIETEFLYDDSYGVDAALWVGTVGISGFNAIADIIAGTVNPSGHLSDTFWYRHSDNPVLANFGSYKYTNYENYDLPMSGKDVNGQYNSYIVYQEGIYVGYRYAETRYADVVTGRANAGNFNYSSVISQPFGYGQSYTDFEYSNYTVTQNNDHTYTVSVDVKNVGSTYSGKEVVQIYVQKPFGDYDVSRGIEKSAIDLVGYGKTSELAPGAAETVTIKVSEQDFAVYDSNDNKTYIVTEGDYYLAAGTDAHNALNNILAAQGYTTANGMDESGDQSLVKSFKLAFDNTTWATSSATGNKITNLFDDVDLNNYFGGTNTVTYMTRTDWAGTVPATNVSLKMNSALVSDLLAQDDPSDIAEDATAYPTYGVDAGLQLIDMRVDADGDPIAYDDEVWDTFMDQLTWDEIATLVSVGLRQTALVQSIGKIKTVEHNGPAGLTEKYGANPYGLAARTNDPDKDLTPPYYPCGGILAATFNVELAAKFGDMLGEDAIWAGYAGFYGIGLNNHRSPYEGRAYEYFSEDSFLSGTMATEEVIALQAHGCNAYIKHFALNDMETQRNGISVWLTEQTLRENYLKPFAMTVVNGGAKNAMAAFVRIGATYCPASSALLTDYLRGELGMTGFVVTDMYNIGYKTEHMPTFLMAGCDLPDGELDIEEAYGAFKTNHGDVAWTMRESAKRILYTTVQSNAMNSIASGAKIVQITPDWMIALIAVDCVLGVLFAASVVFAAVVAVRSMKKSK